MNFELFLSRRLSRSNLNRNYYSGPITNICISAIAISIIIIIITIGCAQGLELAIKKTMIDAESEIQISSINQQNHSDSIFLKPAIKESILNIKGIKNIYSIISKPGIITIDNHLEGVILKGIDSTYKKKVINKSIVDGKYMKKDNHILISKQQSQKLNLKTGDSCLLYFVSTNYNIQKRKFIISGIYNMKNEKFNEFYIFAQNEYLKKINNWKNNQVSYYEIELNKLMDSEKIVTQINKQLNYDLLATSITNRFPGIFSWINLFKKNMILIIVIMCIICLINMTSALLILVLERLQMIGILKSYGCSNYSILKIFAYSSRKIATKGLLIGNIIGFILCLIQQKTQVISLNPTSYFVDYLPIYLNLDFIVFINIIIFIVIQISILIPYYIITKLSPSNILKIK